MMIQKKTRKLNNQNKGTTFIEMIVSFALLSIFLVSAAAIISTIVSAYYRVKAETYSKQVSDILMEKIVSEIEGARFDASGNDDPVISDDNTKITLYDKTNTKVSMYMSENEMLELQYYGFKDAVEGITRESTIWRFDKNVYNGYTLKSLKFVFGDELDSFAEKSDYNMPSGLDYDDNVVIVFMKLNNYKYGDYYIYRVVKLYNAPKEEADPSGGGGA